MPENVADALTMKPKLYQLSMLWTSQMFTLLLNSEIRKVTGLVAPCHRPCQNRARTVPEPCQNPAMCPAVRCATLFGPAAQAARRSMPAAASVASVIGDLSVSTPVHVEPTLVRELESGLDTSRW
jgi:hypothetical protein